MAKNFNEFVVEDRRLTILRLLAEAKGYDINENIIRRSLNEFGFQPSFDQLRGDFAWLEEQSLVVTRETSGVMVAELTVRGQDVGYGRANCPGVAKPRPGMPGD